MSRLVVLNKYFTKQIRSLATMDEFGERDENYKYVYDKLLLTKVFRINYDERNYWVNLSLERKAEGMKVTEESITFTELKSYAKSTYYMEYMDSKRETKGFYALINLINETLIETMQGELPTEENISLRLPFRFRAQNSSNRMGYGSIYSHGNQVYQGTLYGATTEYIISSICLS